MVDSIFSDSSSAEGKIVVYSVHRAPISYVGELSGQSGTIITLSKVLVLFQGQNESVQIGALPYAKRESSIVLDTETIPGLLIQDIDEDLKATYKKEIFACYSKLKLA